MRLTRALFVILMTGGAAIALTAVIGDLGERSGGEPRPPPAGPAPRFGFNEQRWAGEWQHDSDLALLAAVNAADLAGADTARIVVPWFDVIGPDGSWDETAWSRYRAADEAMERQGIEPVIVLVGAPRGGAGQQGDPDWEQPGCAAGLASPPAAAYDGEWAELVTRTANEFDRALGIQIWNEPNSPDFWGGCAPDGERYLELVELARRAVARSEHPGRAIVSAGLNPSQGSKVVPWESYLAELAAAGLVDLVDAIGLHPYPSPADCDRPEPTLAGRLAAAVGEQVDRAAELTGGRAPIWVTEFGASSAAGLTADCRALSEEQQAATLAAMYEQLRARAWVEVAIVHQLVDDADSPEELQNHFGVTRELPLLAPKQAYLCLVALRGAGQGSCPAEG